ncbi:MAG: MBOAT family protein [Candidatus Cloacimonetes bacterium]|jgi:D-alanyl-lipoteichoic acid acyltransferase DltB (MBOAT superfamily)|nr:MBOAT family protein [Candidatus Cloacimonadota bacterium]MCB5287469.1 MBOAT family protein [Candidatus Cloacimonadota bacterium]MCK9185243.1 MBOAT family protein [Candidatus Cloacimonadota bacterium]MCK9583702.1 MBOAT family protein [Candidatus Cloacimonadota bacterium]MDY0229790.1 MBOAT family protein [Candidatus Cloacimonadaceae bacterium]
MNYLWQSILESLNYDQMNPLLFNSTFFLFFFILVLLIYPLVVNHTRIRVWYLLAVSLYFYFKTSGSFVLLLLITALVNFALGAAIHRTEGMKGRRAWLGLSLLWNLGTLGYFKYTNFILGTINQLFGGTIPMMDIFLPVGISFFTFQTWSYTLDIYYKKLEPIHSFKDFAFFVSFFPQLVAGPIVRASYFIPQIHKKLDLDEDTIARALVLIFAGLLKKGVIADYLSVNFVDRIFENPALFSGMENLLGVYAYALQIYCDFSGYSDIAIGLAALMGFTLPINFLSPYRAYSVTDFWRRWHISLSTWLRDYIYIPLGGNRKGKSRQYLNLGITMLLGGLWHGASWNFVFWGGLHGVALIFDKAWLSLKIAHTKLMKVIGIILTFHFVCFAWIFFRSRTFADAWLMINRIFTAFNAALFKHWFNEYQIIAYLIVIGFLAHWQPDSWQQAYERFLGKMPWPIKSLALALVIWILYQAKSADLQPFIYFQF